MTFTIDDLKHVLSLSDNIHFEAIMDVLNKEKQDLLEQVLQAPVPELPEVRSKLCLITELIDHIETAADVVAAAEEIQSSTGASAHVLAL